MATLSHPWADALESRIQSRVYLRGEINGPLYQRVFVAETDCSRAAIGKGSTPEAAIDALILDLGLSTG